MPIGLSVASAEMPPSSVEPQPVGDQIVRTHPTLEPLKIAKGALGTEPYNCFDTNLVYDMIKCS